MDEQYSNREIDRMFNEIKDSLQRIEFQTTKHNGRLTRLERYMWMVVGGMAVLSFAVTHQGLVTKVLAHQ